MTLNPETLGSFTDPGYYDELARLRRDEPVRRYAPNSWTVACYDDVRAVSRDPERFCSGKGVLVNDPLRHGGKIEGSILHMDPPVHAPWRGLVTRRFTPRAVGALEARVRAVARSVLDEVPAGRGDRLRRHGRGAVPGARDRRAARHRRRATATSSGAGRTRPSTRPTVPTTTSPTSPRCSSSSSRTSTNAARIRTTTSRRPSCTRRWKARRSPPPRRSPTCSRCSWRATRRRAISCRAARTRSPSIPSSARCWPGNRRALPAQSRSACAGSRRSRCSGAPRRAQRSCADRRSRKATSS